MARRNIFRRIWEAIRNPQSYAPPPLPPSPPPARPSQDEPQFIPTRFIPASDLPREWGRNEKALWQDATKSNNRIGYDPIAQAYYNTALYTRSEPMEDRQQYMEDFKDYIYRTYGVRWDAIFDWAGYREAYDTAALTN
jgi:hypothetical protein